MAEHDVSFRAYECFSLLRSQLVKMLVDLLDCSEFGNELACSDFTHSLYSWYVIRRVTAYGQDFNDLLRSGDVVFFAYLLYVDDLIV